MSILLGIFAGLLALIFTLLIIVIVVPISYQILIGKKNNVYFTANIQGGKLYRFAYRSEKNNIEFKLSLIGITFSPPNKDVNKEKKPRKKHTQKKKSRLSLGFNDITDNPDFAKAAIHTFLELVNIVRPRKLVISGQLGMTEPSSTGMIIGALAVLDSVHHSYSINVTPLWEEEHLEGNIYIQGKIVLAIILFKALKLFLSKSALRFWKSKRNNKSEQSTTLADYKGY